MPRATSPGLASAQAGDDFVIRQCSVRQRIAVLTEAAHVWRGALTVAEFVELGRVSDRDAYGKRKFAYVLVPRDGPETTDVLAALDLLPRTALVRPAGSTVVNEVDAAFLSRLFVPDAKRGRGYGRLILVKLRELYETAMVGRLRVVYGFALLGEGVFRAHSQWTDRIGVVWRAEDGPKADADLVVVPMTAVELEATCAADTLRMRNDLESRPTSNRIRFAITADAACLRMRMVGTQYTQTRINGQSITQIGARIGEPGQPNFSFILWTRLGEESMIVLRTRAASSRHMRSLLAAVGDEARWQGAHRIRALGLSNEELEGTGLEATAVTDRFPGVSWLGDAPQGELEWLSCDSASSCSFS